MAVDNGFRLWNRLVYFQVKQYLAGSRTISTYLAALQIDKGDVVRRHIGLAAHGGRTNHPTWRDPRRNVAAISVHVLPLPKLLPGANNFLFQRMDGRGAEEFRRRGA